MRAEGFFGGGSAGKVRLDRSRALAHGRAWALSLDGAKGVATIDSFVSKMRERVFKPLGLKAGFFDEASLADLSLGYHYDYTGDPVHAARQPGWDFFPAYYGAGGVVASANDMLK